MDRNDIIRMAMESGITKVMDESSYRWLLEGREPINEVFIKFANLVAAVEREACAKVCDELVLDQYSAKGCAAAIRARGQNE